MKRILFPIFSLFFVIAFSCTVKAATYYANEIGNNELGLQRVNAGDVLEFGTGIRNNYTYSKVRVSRKADVGGGYTITTLYPGDSFVFDIDCFVGKGYERANEELAITTVYTHAYFYLEDENQPYFSNRLTIKKGETKRINIHIDSVVPITSIRILGFPTARNNEHAYYEGQIEISRGRNYVDIEYGKWYGIDVYINCGEDDNGFPLDDADSYSLSIGEIDNIAEDSETEKEEEEDSPVQTPQTPSTVPNGTAQVSVGANDKNFANIKALNQFPHDSVNQKIIADLYAANHKKRTDILMQKNVFPPYGVKNEWKTSSHTIRWNNLNVKKGDSIIVVWYTPTFWGHTSTLKVIPATVVADGTIEFTIPSMGDMSVMSIVKLK